MDWIGEAQERKNSKLTSQYVHEGAILSDGENWERNQREGMIEPDFIFISYFFHSDTSSLWGESVCFTSLSFEVPNVTMPNQCYTYCLCTVGSPYPWVLHPWSQPTVD